MTIQACDPLRDLLGDVLTRLSALETKVGVTPAASTVNKPAAATESSTTSKPSPVRALSIRSLKEAGDDPSVKAYDDFVKENVVNFADACDDLQGLDSMGGSVIQAFDGLRSIITLAGKSKRPEEDSLAALTSLMQPTLDALKQIRDLKLDRKFDSHQKAVNESLNCVSWVVANQLPAPFVRDTLGSAEYWTNRIRKEYRGQDEKQIDFCDALKKMINGLVSYIEEYHKTGLTFNPKGLSFKEALIRMSDEPDDELYAKTSTAKRRPTLGVTAAPNMAGLIGELSKKRTEDGNSAATGLKHVSKDMQTWRKEFKKDDGSEAAAPKKTVVPPPKLPQKKKALKGLPVFEYQDRGFKWVVENHTKESMLREGHENGVLTICISDPKQQVYMYNCDGVTVKITGKFKSLALDQCTKCSVIYDDLISSTEVVNCQRIQLQVNGISPVFTIDKTMNITVYLMSKEILALATFTTSLSSEMNVSFPDGEDQKEVAIPEQFVHKLVDGRVKSEVSDLYH